MRKGSTSFGACEVRRWRWLFGNKIPVSIMTVVNAYQVWALVHAEFARTAQGFAADLQTDMWTRRAQV